MQFTTDCGSETTQVFGLSNALRYVSYRFPENWADFQVTKFNISSGV